MFHSLLDNYESRRFKRYLFFYPVRIVFKEFLPVCLACGPGKWIGHLIVVTQSYSQGIGRIQVLRVKFHFQSLLDHHADLLLRCGSVTTDGYFCLTWSVLGNRYATHYSRCEGSALSSSELQYHLGILSIERRLDSNTVRIMCLDQFAHSGKDIGKLLKRILDLPQVEHSHIDIVWTFGVHTNDPVTKNIGSGINA